MASVIVSNTGSLVLNDGSSTVPKGGYTVSTSNDKVYVKSGSVTWTLDFNDTTLDGADYGSAKELASALSDFSRGGSGPGPEPGDAVWGGITGTLSDQTDLNTALGLKANTTDLGTAAAADTEDFATAAQGSKADTALQSFTEADPTVPAHVKSIQSTDIATWNGKQNALSVPSQAEVEAGTATTARSITAQRIRQGADAAIAASNKVGSAQEGGVGTVITNIIQVTQAQYDGLTPQAGTFYAIVG